MQIADITGTAGVSFVVMLVNVALFIGFDALSGRHSLRDTRWSAAAAILFLFAVLLYGRSQLVSWNQSSAESLKVALVQGNIPRQWRSASRKQPSALRQLRRLTENVLDARPDLVVWPENAVGFMVPANETRFEDITSRLEADSRLLLGAPRAVSEPSGVTRFRNSAFLMNAQAEIVTLYDKIRLTPYAEYSPWRRLPLMPPRFAAGDLYAAGTELTLFEVGGHPFATLICFEAVYADLARRFVNNGAEFLVNISNDDWFGQQPAIEQHFIAASFRSVENRRTLVRVTNTGVTAVVDARGAIVTSLPRGVADTAIITIHPTTSVTFYTRWGDVFAWACVTLTTIAVVLVPTILPASRRARRSPGDGPQATGPASSRSPSLPSRSRRDQHR